MLTQPDPNCHRKIRRLEFGGVMEGAETGPA
jgi:hypothetical protein